MFSRLAYVRVEWSDILVPHKAAATFNDGLVISLQRKFGVDAWVELVDAWLELVEVFPFFVEVFLVGFFTVIGVVVRRVRLDRRWRWFFIVVSEMRSGVFSSFGCFF